MNKVKVAFFVFVLVSVLDILGIILEIPLLVYIFKPLILLSLIYLYVVFEPKRSAIYITALFFSFLGDVFLLLKGEDIYFMLGLVSFLIAHILFIKIVLSWLNTSSLRNKVLAFIPFFISFSSLMYLLKDSLGDKLIPVIVYGITISFFGVLAFLNYLNKKSTKEMYMLLGALVFICSDSVLAINKFYFSATILNVVVMVTYVLAQYLIYKSITQKKSY